MRRYNVILSLSRKGAACCFSEKNCLLSALAEYFFRLSRYEEQVKSFS